MFQLTRTNSENKDFKKLVQELDKDLAVRNGDTNAFFAQFNKTYLIKNVVVAYDEGSAAGCGAIKEYDGTAMEVKRMYVPVEMRGKGVASAVLKELENWAKELGYNKCILETGDKMPEAIGLYKKIRTTSSPIMANIKMWRAVFASKKFYDLKTSVIIN